MIMKATQIITTRIRAIINDLNDTTADYIFCSMEEEYQMVHNPNVLVLPFDDTEVADHPYRFRPEQARKIKKYKGDIVK